MVQEVTQEDILNAAYEYIPHEENEPENIAEKRASFIEGALWALNYINYL